MKTAKVLSVLIVIFFITNGLAAQNSALPKYFYGNYSAKIGSKQIDINLMVVDSIVSGYYLEPDSVRSSHVGWTSRIQIPDSIYIFDDYSMFGENDTARPIFSGKFEGTSKIIGSWRGLNVVFAENKNKSVDMKIIRERKAYPNETDSVPQADAVVYYPKFSTGNADASNRINAAVMGKLLEKVDENGSVSQFRSVQSILENFIAEYVSSTAEYNEYRDANKRDSSIFPDFLPPWYLFVNFSIPHNDRGILSYIQVVDVYSGGAHGMVFADPMVFDCKSGSMLKLDDIISAEGQAELLMIADSIFRRNNSISPDSAINSNGNWFAQDTFYLPTKFYVDRSGMVFFYDLYEVTSYAEGMPEIFIPWARIEKLIRKESAVRRLLK